MSSVVEKCAAMESASVVAATSFTFDSTKTGGNLEEQLGRRHRQQTCAQKRDDPRLSAINSQPLGDVHERRLRAKPIAHLAAKLHAALVVVVAHSVVKRRVEGVVRVLRQRFRQEHLKTFRQPHCCQRAAK